MIEIPLRTVLKLLVGLSLTFVLLNLARLAWIDVMGAKLLNGVWARFDLDLENSIPTWFSSILLLTAGGSLGAIALEKRRRRERFVGHWTGLAVIFLLMSIDEVATIHELLIHPMRQGLDLSGALYFGWVIPASVFVLLFVIAYLRLLRDLPPLYRKLFVVSGVIYVFGAVGMEMVGGEIIQLRGRHPAYALGSR